MLRIHKALVCSAALLVMLSASSCKKSDETANADLAEKGDVAAKDSSADAANVAEVPVAKPEDSTDVPSEAPIKGLPAYQYPETDALSVAITAYLLRELCQHYDAADVCIPSMTIVGSDMHNQDDILVWGDFWVFQYKLNQDTLETVAGGSYPGLMHLKKTDLEYAVMKMDIVADGSDNLTRAKQIFGDKYDAFHKINSNVDEREKVRLQFISDYVKKNNLPITKVKDFGHDAVALP